MTDLPQAAIDTGPREAFGKVIRDTWVATAKELLTSPAPSWLVPWEDLEDKFQREVDMRMGVAVAIAENLARLGVDPTEWDMYASALGDDMTPAQVLDAVRACTTRAELDKLTEDG